MSVLFATSIQSADDASVLILMTWGAHATCSAVQVPKMTEIDPRTLQKLNTEKY
jgi:hypothetical protein